MNDYWEKNHEAHGESAVQFKKTANVHCSSNVLLPTICLCALYCILVLIPISLMKQYGITYQEIDANKWHKSPEHAISSDIEDDNLYQQNVLHVGPVYQVNF